MGGAVVVVVRSTLSRRMLSIKAVRFASRAVVEVTTWSDGSDGERSRSVPTQDQTGVP